MKNISQLTHNDCHKLLYDFELSTVLKYTYPLKQRFLDIKKLA